MGRVRFGVSILALVETERDTHSRRLSQALSRQEIGASQQCVVRAGRLEGGGLQGQWGHPSQAAPLMRHMFASLLWLQHCHVLDTLEMIRLQSLNSQAVTPQSPLITTLEFMDEDQWIPVQCVTLCMCHSSREPVTQPAT